MENKNKKVVKSGLERVKTGLAGLALLASTSIVKPVTLGWDPSPDSGVSGYAVHYGTNSGAYYTRVDVGNLRTCTITKLTPGVTYYFVVTYTSEGSESLDSLPSTEVSYTVPGIPSPKNLRKKKDASKSFLGAEGIAVSGYRGSRAVVLSGFDKFIKKKIPVEP